MTCPKICLNMIVKNEAHVILETLENFCKYINLSYYVISDTGSTDDTVNVIRNFFESKNIKGEIHFDEWKDFGYNRTLALKYAHKKSDYLIVFDADDKIVGDFKLPEKLDKDGYYLKFGLGVVYKRILIVNNQLEWQFTGILHEYINCVNKNNSSVIIDFIEGNYYIESGKTGDRSKDPDKYYKDALILEKAFDNMENDEQLRIRYAFYCAQSYRDCNRKEKAIEWYKKRIDLKHWDQEIYFSYMMIGRLYYDLNEIEKAIYYWSLGIEADKDRYECIFEIVSHFRKNGFVKTAYNYSLMLTENKPDLNNKLFSYYPIYDFLMDYELSILCSHNNKHKEGIKIYNKLFLYNGLPLDIKVNILENFIYYKDHAECDLDFNENYFNFVRSIYWSTRVLHEKHINIINDVANKLTSLYQNYDLKKIKDNLTDKLFNKNKNQNKNGNKINIFWSMTTCKRYDLFFKTMDSFLLCCKDIENIDYFYCVDDNSSNDDRKKMLLNYPFLKFYFKKEHEKGHLNSMNMIWNKLNELKPQYWIHMEDDWLFIKPCNYVEKSIKFLEKYKNDNIHQILFNKNYGELIDCYNLVGGSPMDNNEYLLHIKDEPITSGRTCAYWPHYSFRPSMCIVDTILKLGDFNSENNFFEVEYANKYFASGYKSAYYNEICCLHTGKLTSERNGERPNAYDLNGTIQFNGYSKNNLINNNFKYVFYNLDKYENNNENIEQNKITIKEINSNNININNFVKKIFEKNSFGSNKNIICKLLTHINIWKLLINDQVNDTYIINSNMIIFKNIDTKIKNIIENRKNTNWDIILLNNAIENESKLESENNKIIKYDKNKHNINENINDLSYIITKSCAQIILNFIKDNGILESKNLLNILLLNNNLEIFIINDDLTIKDCINYDIDEYKSECIDFNNIIIENDYIYIQNKDHFGDDIACVGKKNIDDLIFNAELFDNCIGFNTLGYLKNNIDINKLIILNTGDPNDGLFINIKKYNNKYENKIIIPPKNKFINIINKTIDNDDNEIKKIDNLNINNLINEIKNNTECIGFTTDGSLKKNINLSLCKDSDTNNIYIDFDKYIKLNYTNFKLENNINNSSLIKIINDKYIFIQNFDINENNMLFDNTKNIIEMMEIANNMEDCIGFNSFGFFKNNIDILSRNNYISSGKNGIYIKINKLVNKYLIFSGINTIDPEIKYDDSENNDNYSLIQNYIENNNEYIAFTSEKYLKKNITLKNDFENNIIIIPENYNNKLYINFNRYYKELTSYNLINHIKKYFRVKLICSWCDSENLCININKLTMGQMKWGNLEFTFDDNNIDYYLIIDKLYNSNNIYYNPEKTILLHPSDNESWYKNINFLKICSLDDYSHILYWNINKNYFDLKYTSIQKKFNKIGIYKKDCNDKINELLDYINTNNLYKVIDVLSDDDSENEISYYKYNIIFNEYAENYFISNELASGILNESLCIYCGEKSVYKYLNNDSVIDFNISCNINDLYNLIKNTIDNNKWEEKINLIKNQKNKFLDNYNLVATISNIIENLEMNN